MKFKIGRKKFLLGWFRMKRFTKLKYWFFHVSNAKSHVDKIQQFTFVLLGFIFQFTRPYSKKFTYSKMPKIKGRRKS